MPAEREAREARALRANLLRRKEQARARAERDRPGDEAEPAEPEDEAASED